MEVNEVSPQQEKSKELYWCAKEEIEDNDTIVSYESSCIGCFICSIKKNRI